MSNRSLKISGIILLVLCGVYILIYFPGSQFTDKFSEIFFTRIVRVKCLDYKQSAFSRKLNNKIPDYIETSILNGIIKCKDESDLRHRVDEGKLVRIKDDKGYVIEQMSHSYPYLTKEGKDLLQEIGKRFREKISDTRMKGSSFRITSLTRTTEKLRDLRHVNSNTSMNSPHLYGNAFDISYIRFTTRRFYVTQCDKKYLKEALAEVIWQLRNERRCWATYETNQNCFHVVAR